MNRFSNLIGLAVLFLAVGAGCEHQCTVDDEDERTVRTDEITAAGQLKTEPARVDGLQRMAARSGLNPAEQKQLACMAIHHLKLDESREQVLNVLIDNPDFSEYGKSEILQNLKSFKSDEAKTRIIQRMQGRGDPKNDSRAPRAPITEN